MWIVQIIAAIKKSLKIFLKAILIAGLVLFTGLLALQTPRVQTFIAGKAAQRLEKSLDGRITFSSLYFRPFNAIVAKDVVILDGHPTGEGEQRQDTLFRARSVIATFTLKGLIRHEGLHLGRAVVDDGLIAIVHEPTEYAYNLFRILGIIPEMKKLPDKPVFDIRRLEVNDFEVRFIYPGLLPSYSGTGLNWGDIDLTANVLGHNLNLSYGSISGAVDHADFKDKCGYEASHASGKVRVGEGLTLIENIRLKDECSDISVPILRLSYADGNAFKHFMDEVQLDVRTSDSRLGASTISALTGTVPPEGTCVRLSPARLNGTVSDLSVRRLAFAEEKSGVSGKVNASVKGLPSLPDLLLDLDLKDLEFKAKGLPVKLDLKAAGPVSRLAAQLRSDVGDGSARADVILTGLLERKPGVSGYVSTSNLDIGGIIGNDIIRQCTLASKFSARLDEGVNELNIDSLRVDRLRIHGYDYSGIQAAGSLSGKTFDGRIICTDPNLNFMMQGIVDLSRNTENALYNFYAYLGYADLHALNIDSRPVSRVSLGSLNANFTRVSRGDLSGRINARRLRLENSSGVSTVERISANSRSSEGNHDIHITSDFADLRYHGSQPVTELLNDLQAATLSRNLPELYSGEAPQWKGENYSLNVDFHDSRELLSFIMPGLYIADSTSVRLDIARNGSVEGQLISPRIAMKEKYLKRLDVRLDNKENAINCKLTGEELNISPKLNFRQNSMVMYATGNNLGMGYYFDNEKDSESHGELYLTASLSRDEADSLQIDARTLASNFFLGGEQWRIRPSQATVKGGRMKIASFDVENEDQLISISGGLSRTKRDTLNLSLRDLDLASLGVVLGDELDIDGTASGRAMLLSPISNPGLLATISSRGTHLAGYDAGDVQMASSWNEERKSFDIILRNTLGGVNNIDARGFYRPDDSHLKLDAQLSDFQIGYASPVVKSLFSTLEGLLSGRIGMDGPLDRPALSSEELRIRDGLLKVTYTDVPYRVEGPLEISSKGVLFRNAAISDAQGGTGRVNGGVRFDHLRDISLDTHIQFEDMLLTDIPQETSLPLWGTLIGTGRMSVTGPMNALAMDIDATSTKRGSLHIPMKTSGSSGPGDLLVFKEEEKEVYIDPYELMMSRLDTGEESGRDLNIRLRANATPLVDVYLELDKTAGNALHGNGSGTIGVDWRYSDHSLNVSGDYTLNDGTFLFSAMGLASREFTIQDGSTVKFNGDIMDSDLDLTALYITKTSLAGLIAGSPQENTSGTRTVECSLGVSGKLLNPSLDFDIDIPDLNPSTKSLVQSALNTEDKVQKQFLALLITGSFLPDEQSGIFNTTSATLLSNVAEMMAGQINSILSKLDIPLDLGLNYQSGYGGSDIFDVAISTQLFNNRVIVNGAIGNRQYGNTATEDVVGDIDIEIKLDNSGQLRLNLFSHSADQYTNYLDYSQRNGAGIAYQKEFDSWGEFLKTLFMSRENRRRYELEKATGDVETVTIDITK